MRPRTIQVELKHLHSALFVWLCVSGYKGMWVYITVEFFINEDGILYEFSMRESLNRAFFFFCLYHHQDSLKK